MDLDKIIADTIDFALKSSPESVENIGKAIGISRSTLYNYSTGKTKAAYSDLLKICNYLHVDINAALGLSGKKYLEQRVEDLENVVKELEGRLDVLEADNAQKSPENNGA